MLEIKIKGLIKKYGNKIVLDNISLDLAPGIFGLLGPNGAGKTTLMKCIVKLIKYQGTIEVTEDNLRTNTQIGYLPQKFSMFKQLKVIEALEYIALLKKVSEVKDEVDRVLEKVNLMDEKNKKIKNLSGGMLRRLGIGQALIGNPKILIIDEPTVGLDPKERIRIRNLLANLKRDMIIIISTHIVEDLDAIANTIAILKDGKILEYGSIEKLLSNLNGKVGTVIADIKNIKEYEDKNIVTSINHSPEGQVVRLISNNLPNEAKIVIPKLEDVYFYYNGVNNNE